MILISIVHDAKLRTHTETPYPLDAEHTIRVTCRSCFSRWDIENTTYISPRTKWEKIDRFGIVQNIALAVVKTLLKTKRYSFFHRIYNRLQNAFAYNPNFRYMMADFYRLTQCKQEMLKATISGAGMTPLSCQAHLKLSDVFCEIGALGAAKLHLDQAMQLGAEQREIEKYVQRIEELQAGVPDNELDYFISWSDAPPPKRVNWLKDAMELNETRAAE